VILHKNGTAQSNIVQSWGGDVGQASGSYDHIIGPNVSARWYLAYQSIGNFFCGNCLIWEWGNSVNGGTVPIKSPANIKASDEEFYDKINLSWAKGTDLPTANVQYRIYRGTTLSNGTLVQTVSGTTYSWTDVTIVPNDVYYYWVTTYSSTSSWGVHESARNNSNAVTGKAKTITVDASDGLYTNRVKIQWEDPGEICNLVQPGGSGPETVGNIVFDSGPPGNVSPIERVRPGPGSGFIDFGYFGILSIQFF
jgi:hypothetical protein